MIFETTIAVEKIVPTTARKWAISDTLQEFYTVKKLHQIACSPIWFWWMNQHSVNT